MLTTGHDLNFNFKDLKSFSDNFSEKFESLKSALKKGYLKEEPSGMVSEDADDYLDNCFDGINNKFNEIQSENLNF